MMGARLKLARKKAGLSLRDLAHAIGGLVSAQALGKYERDEMVPSAKVLHALSKALGVSMSFLMDAQRLDLAEVDFRTKANTTKADRAKVETEVLEWVSRYLEVERILDRDSRHWEAMDGGRRAIRTLDEAEDLANSLREHWELGEDPIPNMTELLEEKGLKVLIEELPARVSGFTCLVTGEGADDPVPAIVVNKSKSLERRRITLAHELAHRLIDPQHLNAKEEEKAANRFAGAFLVPREHLEREIGKHRNALGYRELLDIKRLYRVSGAAMLVRLRDVGIIDDGVLSTAFQTVARTWRSEEPEPIEDEARRGDMEKPRRFERLCYWALAEKLISVSKAAELLRKPVTEVEEQLKGPWRAGHRQ